MTTTLTPLTAAEVAALASEVAADRFARLLLGPANAKGRSAFRLDGEPSEAERVWDALMAPHAEAARLRREALTA